MKSRRDDSERSINWEVPITINNNLYKTYLIGSMESPAKSDGGIGWRQTLTPELTKRGIYAFDPTREEIKKVGMPTEELMQKLLGWQLSGNWKLFTETMRKIWRGASYIQEVPEGKEAQVIHIMGDVDYVEHSDFVIWNHEEGDQPGGTIAELVIAWYRGIPVYLLTSMPKSRMNKSLLYFLLDSGRGQGAIFSNQSDLLDFLDERYQLKSREPKKEA